MAREYWNKYPKTDYTYSPLSKDRVELAPGQVAMPNMSRRSLSQFRVQGPTTSADELDQLSATTAWTTSTLRKRYTSLESSDDESAYIHGKAGELAADSRWWITRMFSAIVTAVATRTRNAYRKAVGPSHRYPYTDRRPVKNRGILSQTASAAAAPLLWIYTVITTVITTTVTTVTETFTPKHVGETEKYTAGTYQNKAVQRRWWPWMLLLLLPALGYGSHYTYENWEHLAVPNFTDFRIDFSEFSAIELLKISLPNISLPYLDILPSIELPDINITLPDIKENLPEVTKTYREYKDTVQNRMADASDYMKVVAESCFEELRRLWRNIIV